MMNMKDGEITLDDEVWTVIDDNPRRVVIRAMNFDQRSQSWDYIVETADERKYIRFVEALHRTKEEAIARWEFYKNAPKANRTE